MWAEIVRMVETGRTEAIVGAAVDVPAVVDEVAVDADAAVEAGAGGAVREAATVGGGTDSGPQIPLINADRP